MNRAFIYIFKHYIKSFLILLIGLVSIISLIDFLQHFNSIVGINRALLYIYYSFNNSINILYPLVLVFAAIVTLSSLLFKNHLLILQSFGYSKKFILKPFLFTSIMVYLLFIALNFTPFAYSGDRAEAILNNSDNIFKPVDNLFFKYNNYFVFAKEMDVVNKEFKNLKLYYIKNGKIDYIMEIKRAKFKDKYWLANDILKKSFIYKDGIPRGYTTQKIKEEKILKGYYPKVVRLLYEGKRMNILDGIKAKKLLNEQNIDDSKIVSTLLERIIMPLFAPLLITIIVILIPIHKRYLNRAKFYFLSIGSTLVIWSILYSINMISSNGVISPYLGEPIAIFILFIITILIFLKKDNRI